MIDITLDKLAGGELGEQFEKAAKRVIKNLLDPNTPYKAKRSITIKITFEQNEARNDVALGVNVDTKLASQIPFKTNLSIGKDLRSNELYVKEYGRSIPGQMNIDDYQAIGKKVDTETGEILE